MNMNMNMTGKNHDHVHSMKPGQGMHMTFYWGKEVTLLFDEWTTTTSLQYWAALALLFAASIFHEYVVSRRAHLKTISASSYSNPGKLSCCPSDEQGGYFRLMVLQLPGVSHGRWLFLLRVAETFLFGVNALLGYLLMLAAMSFNGGVVLSIVFGLCVGFLCFRSGYFVAIENDEELQLSADPCSSCT